MITHWNWRLASRLSVVTLAVLVVILVTVIQQHNQAVITQQASTGSYTNPSGLQGSDLGSVVAPDFRLSDQFGKQVSLSQFKGEPVILTFLYTHCPDVCPLTAEKLHSTIQMLNGDAQKIGIVAVTIDPARDNQAAALSFSKSHNMQDDWHYLVGTRNQLSPIWSDYHIFVQQQQQAVNHSMGLYLIDKQGKQRVYMDTDFTPDQLSANLKILLKE
jgi:protein SCO1/2